jgi:hypothetical protein
MKKLKFSVLALCVGAFLGGKTVAQVPNYVPTNGLVGWWPFNGNANDESGNGNNGTVNGATLTTDRFGVVNSAYYFSSSGCATRIDVNVNTSSIQTGLTMSVWVMNVGDGCLGPRLLEFGGNDGPGQAQWGTAYGNLNLYGIGSITSTGFSCSAGIPMSPNNIWSHLVYTNNGIQGKFYKDGILITTINSNGNPILASSAAFGRMNHPAYDAYNGNLDDIGIWNRALTDCEIQDLYTAQLGSFSNTAVTVTPTSSSIGSNATLTVSSPVSNLQWQSNPGSMGWNNVIDNGNYNGATNDTLVVSNLQLSNHNQPFRVLACGDTSNIATIQIADTCITTVYDTLLTTVTDTLIINTTLSLPAPNNENTILIYPNPASDHITIDNGNFSAMAGYSIKIENNAGQQVFQSLINQAQFYVDLSTWTGNGLYFVHLIDPQNNTVTVRKIVLQ